MLSDDLPPFIEEPEEYLPTEIPPTDVVVAIKVHHDILTSLPELLDRFNIPALIVPVEDGARSLRQITP